MTLQEAKDQVSEGFGCGPWREVKIIQHGSGFVDMVVNEVAELYARSKWDEACEAQREMCSASWASSPYDVVSEREAIECAPKPEFKP